MGVNADRGRGTEDGGPSADLRPETRDARPPRLAGKVAVITGAGGGIGGAACRRFTEEGVSVVAVEVDAERLEAVTGDPCRRFR
jgi:hypothetical protein